MFFIILGEHFFDKHDMMPAITTRATKKVLFSKVHFATFFEVINGFPTWKGDEKHCTS